MGGCEVGSRCNSHHWKKKYWRGLEEEEDPLKTEVQLGAGPVFDEQGRRWSQKLGCRMEEQACVEDG